MESGITLGLVSEDHIPEHFLLGLGTNILILSLDHWHLVALSSQSKISRILTSRSIFQVLKVETIVPMQLTHRTISFNPFYIRPIKKPLHLSPNSKEAKS
jgi:hypothetical protein